MHDEIWVAADGRGEVRIAGSGEREVALVLLAVAGLAEGAQHEIGEDALLWLAGDLRRELLVHARRDGDVFRDLVPPLRPASAPLTSLLAALATCLEG